MMPTETPDAALPSKKTIFIVDDHPMLRRGLIALIESSPDLAACGEAATVRSAIEAIGRHRPDLVIVDLELGADDGLELVGALKTRQPEIPALVFSMYDESAYAERALRAGARGYLTKQQLDDRVLVAIRHVLDGGIYMSEAVAAGLAARYVSGGTPAADSPVAVLSDRELQVFRAIGQGRTTRQIAEALHLSIKTIESHREHIKQKLCVESGAELARRAAEWVSANRGK